MDAVLHSSMKLQKILTKFIPVKIGIEAPGVKDLGVRSIPLLVFFDFSGNEIYRHIGYLPEDKLMALFKKILSFPKKIDKQ